MSQLRAAGTEAVMKVEAKQDQGKVEINPEECKGCGLCVAACPVHVMRLADYLNSRGYHPAQYLGAGCTGCGICFYACPEPGAITVYVLERSKPSATVGLRPSMAVAGC